jgi:hypothetical protein
MRILFSFTIILLFTSCAPEIDGAKLLQEPIAIKTKITESNQLFRLITILDYSLNGDLSIPAPGDTIIWVKDTGQYNRADTRG